jgi:hypothetical protein
MPLASWFGLHWYGPGAIAAVRPSGATVELARLSGEARANGTAEGVGASPLAKPTRLRNRPGFANGVGAVQLALPKARARLVGVVRVNELTQDDVTGAVLEAPVEAGLTLRQALRLISAALAGKVSGAGTTTITIRDTNDTKDRIVATVDANGNRTAVTRDVS